MALVSDQVARTEDDAPTSPPGSSEPLSTKKDYQPAAPKHPDPGGCTNTSGVTLLELGQAGRKCLGFRASGFTV